MAGGTNWTNGIIKEITLLNEVSEEHRMESPFTTNSILSLNPICAFFEDNVKEIIEWAVSCLEISHKEDTLVVGKYKDKKFRIFRGDNDNFAGVIGSGESFNKSHACFNLDEFKEELEFN